MFKRKILVSAVILLIIATSLVIATGCGRQAKSDNGRQVIKVGYFPNVTHAQALVGLNDGTFQKALGSGMVIEEYTFNAGPSEIEAMLTGEIDLGYIGPVPAINGFAKSKGGLRIVAGAADAGAILVARKGTNIKTVNDLDGKKVAIPQLGNTQDISLRNLLTEANLKDAAKGGTVTVIPAENPDILTLLTKGEIDAALVPEPWGSRIIKQAGASIVLDSSQVWRNGKYTTAVVIVSTKFLETHPDVVEKWIKAHVELTERINGDKQATVVAINARLKKLTNKVLPEDVLKSSLQRITITYDPETDSIREFVNISLENGYIKEKIDTNKIFYLDILNKVLAQKGLKQMQ